MSTPLRQSFPATSSTWAAPISVLAVACLLFPGCTDSLTAPEDEQDISTLDVIPDSTTLVQGDTVRLEAIAKGPQGNDVSGSTITWTSGDTTIATVNSDGVATGQSPGSTTITASAENQESGPLSDQSKVVVAGNLVSGIQPAEYTTDITAIGEAVYVDRDFSIEEVPSRFKGWTYVRTANDDKSIQDASAVALTLTDTATVALAYDKRARVLPNWLEGWTDTGRVLKTTDARHDIFTRAFGPGDATLGGNQSGGAEGARSMYVLFTTRSDSLPDDAGEVGTGSLEVGVSTSGEDQDSDGYVVTVRDSSRPVDPNGSTTFSSLIADEHIVELSGIHPNCSVDGQNPRTTIIEGGGAAQTTFSVDCTATTGSLEVSASTTGDDPDTGGYTAIVDESSSQDLGPNGMVTFSGLTEGDHTVELSSINPNCSVDGQNPRTVSINAESTTSNSFSVTCSATAGALDVGVSTSGEDQDNGYTAIVDGNTSKDLGPNGSVTFSGLTEGNHTVEFSNVASNCSVEGSNPRTVTVQVGGTVSTTFNVSCTATTGSLEANASTSGDDLDTDGYTATVDGSTAKDLGPNGTVTFSGLDEGDHQVDLSGIQSNCSVDGQNPRTATVQAGGTVSTTLNVSCAATTGDLSVSASTSGDDQDSDGYTATVDGSKSQDLGPNGTVTFSELTEGDHTVELSSINPNCSVDGSNPRTVMVTANSTVSTTFSVSCTALTGNLELSASTTGEDQDTDGYTATVDGSTSTDLGPNGSATFSDLSEEDHSIELSGIKFNCSVEGSNPRTVTVTAGSTASTTFNVICTSTTGSLSVSATTTGDDPDPDGYTATVGGTTSKDLGPNGSVKFSGLSEGDRQVELSGIASNCSVEGSNPRTITVEAGGTITTTFFVTCEFFFGTRDAVLWEYEEWSLQNASYSGNPFDVIATVTFEHQGSSKSHTTEMFYDGGDTWKFRFTGTKTGTWTFTTSSDDPELDGLGGTVSVSSNLDENDRGFLAKQGNRLAIQVGDGEVKGFLLNQYQINDDGPYKHTHITTFENSTASKVEAYVTHARERGFTSVYIMLNNNLLEMGAYRYDETSDVNPDLQSFQVLDDIVTTAHEEGMRVHFWRWGDESRKWTPIGLEGGINGTVDQRVTRYFAARLGPLPGWSMGYGFDLAEWTSVSELQVWFDDFQAWLGWEHYLSARAGDLQRSSGLINGYAQGDQELGDFFTDTFPSYSTIAEDLNGDKNTPHLLEERNVLGRWGVDATDTRRLMWRTAIAGGMAGWYGFMNYSDKGPDPVFGGAPGYPNPQELKAHRTFWKNRFLLDLERSNSLTDGHALVSGDNTKYVFYKEGASSIDVDLSGMSGSQPAVAVNTGEPYDEINLGTLSPEQQTIELPANGDWAIAVGEFPE